MARAAGYGGLVGPAEAGQDVPGRQLRSVKKEGEAIGKAKRDKGTKWIVLVDSQGLPP